jgi:hypothetical protein
MREKATSASSKRVSRRCSGLPSTLNCTVPPSAFVWKNSSAKRAPSVEKRTLCEPVPADAKATPV